MNKTIKIGFLFPYSSIFPGMSQDIIDGFNTAIPDSQKSNYQFYPEYIDLGHTDVVKTAINKLISFQNVDVLSGIISYRLFPEIIQVLDWRQKLGFFFDMGEYLPPEEPLPVNIFSNSSMLWQKEFALGAWTQKTFGGKGAILMSVYDAGYHLHSSFWQGAIVSGAEEIDMHTLTFNRGISKHTTAQLPAFFEKIEKADVNFLHALFCGNEALEFFDAFRKSPLYNKIPLIVAPHMVTEEILEKISHLNISCYSVSGWNFHSKESAYHPFVKKYESNYGKMASIFAVMGVEAGLAFREVLPDLEKGDINSAIRFLKNNTISGPRGVRNFDLSNHYDQSPVTIEKLIPQRFKTSRLVVGEEKSMPSNHVAINEILAQSESGWKNPYLCV